MKPVGNIPTWSESGCWIRPVHKYFCVPKVLFFLHHYRKTVLLEYKTTKAWEFEVQWDIMSFWPSPLAFPSFGLLALWLKRKCCSEFFNSKLLSVCYFHSIFARCMLLVLKSRHHSYTSFYPDDNKELQVLTVPIHCAVCILFSSSTTKQKTSWRV